LQPWASEEFFPGWVDYGIFQNFFNGGVKSGEICFFPLEIKKTTFFAEIFKIWGGGQGPFPTPMLATTLAGAFS